MLIRVLLAFMAMTFVFVLAIPVLQVGSLLKSAPQQVATQQAIEAEQVAPQDLASEEDLAAALNDMEPAAGTEFGDIGEGQDFFGAPFSNVELPGFQDNTSSDIEGPLQATDL